MAVCSWYYVYFRFDTGAENKETFCECFDSTKCGELQERKYKGSKNTSPGDVANSLQRLPHLRYRLFCNNIGQQLPNILLPNSEFGAASLPHSVFQENGLGRAFVVYSDSERYEQRCRRVDVERVDFQLETEVAVGGGLGVGHQPNVGRCNVHVVDNHFFAVGDGQTYFHRYRGVGGQGAEAHRSRRQLQTAVVFLVGVLVVHNFYPSFGYGVGAVHRFALVSGVAAHVLAGFAAAQCQLLYLQAAAHAGVLHVLGNNAVVVGQELVQKTGYASFGKHEVVFFGGQRAGVAFHQQTYVPSFAQVAAYDAHQAVEVGVAAGQGAVEKDVQST